MSGSVNRVILVGNLGRAPEIRSTQSGERIANLNIATSESWKDRNSGERKERTEWHRVVIFNEHLVKVAEQYLEKGSKVYVEGQLQTRRWTDQAGVEKYSTEIVLTKFRGDLQMLDSASDTRRERTEPEPEQSPSALPRGGYGGPVGTEMTRAYSRQDLDDEIPFSSNDIADEPCMRKRYENLL